MGLFHLGKRTATTAISSVETGYWDIHNHILPGIDDGAACSEESFRILKMEYEQGVRHIVFTPHFRPGMFTVDASVRERVFFEFLEEAKEIFPGMSFHLGCELHIHKKLEESIADARNRMCGGDVVLLEYSTAGYFRDLAGAVRRIKEAGYRIILAHAERYRCLYEADDYVRQLHEQGVMIQINAETFLEKRRSPRREFAQELMEQDMVSFIASDAHDTDYRPVNLAACRKQIIKQYGQEIADRILKENPERLFG